VYLIITIGYLKGFGDLALISPPVEDSKT